jgi:hypothetical protein
VGLSPGRWESDIIADEKNPLFTRKCYWSNRKVIQSVQCTAPIKTMRIRMGLSISSFQRQASLFLGVCLEVD